MIARDHFFGSSVGYFLSGSFSIIQMALVRVPGKARDSFLWIPTVSLLSWDTRNHYNTERRFKIEQSVKMRLIMHTFVTELPSPLGKLGNLWLQFQIGTKEYFET